MKDSKNVKEKLQIPKTNNFRKEKIREDNKKEIKNQVPTTLLNNKNQQQQPIKPNIGNQPLTSDKQNNHNFKVLSDKNTKIEKSVKKDQSIGINESELNKANQNKNVVKVNEIKNNAQEDKKEKSNEPEIKENLINTNQEIPLTIEFDKKTIKSFMPYFEKNMTYTKKLSKNENKVIMLYDKKIDELINLYSFTEKYLFFITQTFKKIAQPFYYVLTVTYLKDIKPY